MLARAPGDVAHAKCRTTKPFPANWALTQGGSVPGYAGSERAAASAQISQRRAAGMRCAAGQLTELRLTALLTVTAGRPAHASAPEWARPHLPTDAGPEPS
jgi:hypothetical protein